MPRLAIILSAWACLSSISFVAGFAEPRQGRRRPPSTSSSQDPNIPEPVLEDVGSPSQKDDEETVIKTTKSPAIDSVPISKTRRIYSMPALYDMAFGYRNFEEEVTFLINQHKKLHGGERPVRTLELAAGPARHTITALQSDQVEAGIALDTSEAMVDYATEIAQEELDIDSFESFSYEVQDMSDFELSNHQPVDSVWILLGSLQHLVRNEDVISCFHSINKVMSPGGTLILELPHPRETFSLVECTRNGWEIPLEDENGETSGELEIVWGDDNDDFDPITQVRDFTVAMELKGVTDADPSLQSVREIVPMRLFTAQEIDALARITGFEVRSMHGALIEGVEVNDDLEAFRLVTVLQKI